MHYPYDHHHLIRFINTIVDPVTVLLKDPVCGIAIRPWIIAAVSPHRIPITEQQYTMNKHAK